VLLFEWIPKPEFLKNVYIPIKHSAINTIFLFNLPDTLWFLSGILFIRFLWFNNEKWQGIYIICFYGIAIIIEASQFSNNVSGTFDVLDLVLMGIAAFVEGMLHKYFVKGSLK
jgi:hypothetical protein